MKSRLCILFFALWLAACQGAAPAASGSKTTTPPTPGPTLTAHPTPAPKLAVLPAGCKQPGTVQFLSITIQFGIAYDYGLYLPPCFKAVAGVAYPIIYLVPGRSSAPQTWLSPGVAPIADDLIQTRELPPFIIVATSTTDDDMFAQHIINDLMPYIESHYPVSQERRYRAVAGGSLGGIAAYRIGFTLPDRFASVGMFGSGVISGEEARVQGWLQAMTPRNRPRVFLNTGFADPLMLDRARVMLVLLDGGNISHTHIFSDGDHSYAYWLTNMAAYLHWVALDWQDAG